MQHSRSPRGADDDLEPIYRELLVGRGREHVSDANVEALITLADERGHTMLARLLREWRAPCRSRAADAASTIAPTPGFNRGHVQHR